MTYAQGCVSPLSIVYSRKQCSWPVSTSKTMTLISSPFARQLVQVLDIGDRSRLERRLLHGAPVMSVDVTGRGRGRCGSLTSLGSWGSPSTTTRHHQNGFAESPGSSSGAVR